MKAAQRKANSCRKVENQSPGDMAGVPAQATKGSALREQAKSCWCLSLSEVGFQSFITKNRDPYPNTFLTPPDVLTVLEPQRTRGQVLGIPADPEYSRNRIKGGIADLLSVT